MGWWIFAHNARLFSLVGGSTFDGNAEYKFTVAVKECVMKVQSNPELELAFDYIRETSTHVFLTGKAGTGKTTFLRRVISESSKRLAVVAPTGVAAINAGGMTIHSLFQLPFGLFIPGLQNQNKLQHFSRQKLDLLRSLELLVIDEISMVRADLLDAVDEVLRRHRKDDRPFGNVQMLLIGDLHQLPPVVKPEDWDSLKKFYDTPYFFGSHALKKTSYVSIELKHIYRQADADFIELLNKVRDNKLDQETLQTLNSRYRRGFKAPQNEAHITLTSTNAAAQEINNKNLAALPNKPRSFKALVSGEFPPSSYPTEEHLELKVGAQVMFVKNDPSPAKRFFNGKLGQITAFTEQAVVVRCEGEKVDIEVLPAEWQNIKYSLNEESKQIEEKILGTFTQYPLKLAWAITIHKSQGLTFDRAIIDAQTAFAHGQVYVALSRCKSFEGIVLVSPILNSSVKTDPVVQNYSEHSDRNAPSEADIQHAKRQYQIELITELFSFQTLEQSLNRLCQIYRQHRSSLTQEGCDQVHDLATKAHECLLSVSRKFQPHLTTYLQQDSAPESNPELQARISKASQYFPEKLAALRQDLSRLPTQTDNQEVRKSVHGLIESLLLQLVSKDALFKACSQGFSTLAHKRAAADALIDFYKTISSQAAVDSVPANAPHPELYAELLQYRQQMADKQGVSPRSVLTTESLMELVMLLPSTQAAIRSIRGIAKKRMQSYGSDIEAIIRRYREKHQISQADIVATKTKASNTKQQTYEMFQNGRSVEEIAAERKLAVSTIEGHLAHYVSNDELDISRLLAPAKLAEIESYFAANPNAPLGQAKEFFGDKFRYGELVLAQSHCGRLLQPEK